MPKLRGQTIDKNKRQIEQAALRLFTRQGFHGTTVREIARKAGVSMGMLYTYYKTKEAIFVSLVQGMGRNMETLQHEQILPLMRSMDSDSLQKLARAIGRVVSENLDYWRLMYIDVVEFRHKHFIHNFRVTSGNLQKLARGMVDLTHPEFTPGVDPALAYTSIYLHFVTYFLIERLFGAKRHLGVDDETAIDQLVRLFTGGAKESGQ